MDSSEPERKSMTSLLLECHSLKLGHGRNVVVNLRITNDWTRRLGIDLHVCELQLTLSTFAAAVVS